jgi:hypothetical protein
MQEHMIIGSTLPVSLVTSSTTTSPLCPCYRLGQAAQLMTIGPITIVSREFGVHQPGCRFYNYNKGAPVDRSRSLLLSAKYRNSWNASLMRFVVSTSSFLAGVICTTRFVDGPRDDAPGFKHISHAHRRIDGALKLQLHFGFINGTRVTEAQMQRCRVILLQLHDSLEIDFHTSRDWAYIQTWNGETLLHVSTYISKQNLSVFCLCRTNTRKPGIC